MSAQDRDYYRQREQEERERAELSDDAPARRVHLEMAERYSALLREALVPQL